MELWIRNTFLKKLKIKGNLERKYGWVYKYESHPKVGYLTGIKL